MKNIYKYVLFTFVLLMIICPVKAENSSCSYETQVKLQKEAYQVRASYDTLQRADGTYYFKITIYNITKNIFISYSKGDTKRNISTIFFNETNDGEYSFEDDVIDSIETYKFSIRPTLDNCTNSLRSFTLTKPKYNVYSELPDCKYEDVKEYFYCQQWISKDITIGELKVKEKIAEQRNKYKLTKETKCESCEIIEKEKQREEEFNKLKRNVIIGLSIGIVLDIIFIITSIIDIRRNSL